MTSVYTNKYWIFQIPCNAPLHGHIILRNFPFIKSMLPHVYILRFSHVISPFWNARSFPCNFLYVFIFLKIYFTLGGCINSSATKNTCRFCRRHKFSFQYRHGRSQPFMTAVPGDQMLSSDLNGCQECVWVTCMCVCQNTYTLKIKYMFLKDTFYF